MTEKLNKDIKKLLKNFRHHMNSDDGIEYLESNLRYFLNSYKEKFLSGEIKKIDDNFIKSIKKDVDKEIIESFNIDTFFRGIKNILLKKKEKKLEKYFDDYISTIPKRVHQFYNSIEQPDITDVDSEDIYFDPFIELQEFEEWRKILSTVPQFRVKRKRFEIEKVTLQMELLKMREWLEKNNKKLIIVLEGRDTAGKGSFIRTATENLHPSYFKINTFGIPTNYEKNHWFKRYEKVLPQSEQIAFYDRSWYNRAVVEPVMGYCTQKEYEDFMNKVLPFEYKLIDNNYFIIKFWFSITKETQSLRFKLRKSSPIKYWKYTENDSKVIDKWEMFTKFKEEMFNQTSTEKSPWIVVDSNDKRVAKLNALKYILTQIPYNNKKKEVLSVYPEIVYPIL